MADALAQHAIECNYKAKQVSKGSNLWLNSICVSVDKCTDEEFKLSVKLPRRLWFTDIKYVMMIWLLGFLCVVLLHHSNGDTVVQTGICSGAYCDPSYLPYPNMNAALYGYDISKADPFSTGGVGGDPGWRFPIFMATTGSTLIKGAVALHESIEAKDSLQCLGDVERTEITNIKEYKEAQLKTSYRGYDLQIGQEREVEIGVSVPLGGSGAQGQVSSKTKIPPFMTRSSSNTESESKIKNFFSREGGSMMKIESTCSVSTVYVLPGVVPLFNIGFVNAVKTLAAATKLSESSKKFAFRAFMNNYGTHYSKQTTMGSKLVYTMRFTVDEKQEESKTNMKRCTMVTGMKIFGLQVEKNKKDCETKSTYSNDIKSKYVKRQSYASFGSKPATSLSEWSKQEFKQPMPLNMALVPLPNLFTYENLNAIGKIAGVTINQKTMLDWFLPMWKNMCTVMNINCKDSGGGCGLNDDCEWEQICESAQTAKGYKCISNYEPTTNQTICTDSGGGSSENSLIYLDRHSVNCGTGTNPLLGKFRVVGCGPDRINYDYTCTGGVTSSSRCYNAKTHCTYPGPGDGQLIYLDRHKIDCSNGGRKKGYFLNMFHLSRCASLSNIQYEYKCCKKSVGDGQCWTKQTRINPGPELIYLDRHNIDCEGKYLRDIQLISNHLETSDFKEIHYKYTCCDGCQGNPSCTKIQSQTEYKQTTCTDAGDGPSVVFLDRHDLSCGQNVNRWITRFHVVNCLSLTQNDDNIYYDYTCIGNGRANGNCIQATTQCSDQGGGDDGDVAYLDRHKVQCSQQGFFLSRFGLNRCDRHTKIQYQYTCCKKSSTNGRCTTKETAKQIMDGLVYFDRQNIDCEGKYLKDFIMLNADDYSKVFFKYTCCEG